MVYGRVNIVLLLTTVHHFFVLLVDHKIQLHQAVLFYVLNVDNYSNGQVNFSSIFSDKNHRSECNENSGVIKFHSIISFEILNKSLNCDI